MADFDDIRSLTMENIKANRKNENIIYGWKNEIRETLLTVQREFIRHINDYAEKFMQGLLTSDSSEFLAPYYGEDKKH